MADERAAQEAQMRASINQRLIETGKKEELKQILRQTLNEHHWRDDVKRLATEKIRNHQGQMSVEALVAAITPDARALVPDEAKRKLLERIREVLKDEPM